MRTRWRHAPLLLCFVVTTLLCLGWGCRSECHRLCQRQAQCITKTAGEAPEGSLDGDGQQELCETMCGALAKDPERSDAMKRVLKCIDEPCDSYARCVELAQREPQPAK